MYNGGTATAYYTPGQVSYSNSSFIGVNSFSSFYDTKSYVLKIIDDNYIKSLIESKNYSAMIAMADSVLSVNRKGFKKIEKAILESNSFELIGNYIKTVQNIDTKCLTVPFLNAFIKNDLFDKNERFTALAFDIRNKIDIKKCYSYSKKYQNPYMIQWIANSSFEKIVDTIVDDDKISINQLNDIIKLITDPIILFNFACSSTVVNKQAIYKKLLKLNNLELAKAVLELSKDPWAEKLKHLK